MPQFSISPSRILLLSLILATMMSPTLDAAVGANFSCMPCVGIQTDAPQSAAAALGEGPALHEEAMFYIAWTVPLADPSAEGSSIATSAADFAAVREAGAIPWVRVVFHAPEPITENLDVFEAELRRLAELVRGSGAASGEKVWVQAVWQPGGEEVDGEKESAPSTVDEAYVLKRAAVTVTGVSPSASFAAGPFEAKVETLRELYSQDVAAYLDAIVLKDDINEAAKALMELDPGKPIALDAATLPAAPSLAIASAARASVDGAALTFFTRPTFDGPSLAPLVVLANEMRGDISYDPTSAPTGSNGWSFVRGDDLSLRVIAEKPPRSDKLPLSFDDAQLLGPRRINLETGEEQSIFDQSRGAEGLSLTIENPTPAVLVKVRRASIQDLEGVDEQIRITDQRQMPVEEILRLLQAFEDDQARRLDHYEAVNTMHLRFATGPAGIEASYSGDFFFAQDGFDWVWKDFYIDGVKWRGKSLPEIPLIQPEKVAAKPLEILLSKNYDYRLRGSDTIEGRDCWVIDFKPLQITPGESLFQGTVWVDREMYTRVRTRAIQLGLEGDVLSNEETTFFQPIDPSTNMPGEWSRENFVLPTRVVGQQVLSLFSATVPVEQELVLSNLRINAEGFEERRTAAWDTEYTMVRDTPEGMRYLEKNEEGERVVQTEFDTSRFFLVGGIFWDESLEFPLPLAGVNYLDLDFRDTGSQFNIFFAGPFFTANLSNPSLFDSRWNGGISATGFLIDRGDQLYRDGSEAFQEEIESKGGTVALFLGHPLGKFGKVDFTYRVRSDFYGAADDTAEDFILPEDTLTQTAVLELIYDRSGWRFELEGSYSDRGDWEFWGLPGNVDFDPEQSDYIRYEASLRKAWYFGKFRKFGLALDHLGGEDLDRFSRYDFGIFGDSSVSGYQSGLVRADEASGIHLSYGISIADQIRFEIEGDAVWATSDSIGLDNELLAGIGLEGTITTPWWNGLILNFEGGVALDGPGEGGVAARIVFLKLYDGNPFKRKKK